MSKSRRNLLKADRGSPTSPDQQRSVSAAIPPPVGMSARAPWIRWLRIATLVVVAGLLPLILLELGLLVFGFGYPTGFFVPIEGKDAVASNSKFGWRFFPISIARAPLVSYVPVHKDADTYRILVLGDSVAMGIPQPAFGFGQILRVLLESRYPGMKIEVINTAMTAINSHVLPPITTDSSRLAPDLFIVLAGNNEVVGPYGPGTVLTTRSPPMPLIRAGIWFKSTRTAELMETGMARLHPAGNQPEWGGMAMFAGHEVSRDNPLLETVYRHFHTNLEDVSRIARDAKASVILSTVPVNLRDIAPFASVHRSDLSAQDRNRWQQFYDDGVLKAASGDCVAALQQFRGAMQLDGGFADLRYRLGKGLLACGHAEEARKEFLQGRDLDALRFRADSRINDTIRKVATDFGLGIRLADAELAFSRAAAVAETPGNEYFFEHVHLNFAGNYFLANTILPEVEAVLPESIRKRRVEMPVLSEAAAERAVGFTEWDRDKSVMEMLQMMQSPPFTSQSDYAERKEYRERTLAELGQKWTSQQQAARMPEYLAQYISALRVHPDNLDLRADLAGFLSRSGDHPGAAEQYRTLIGMVPDVADWHANLGHELMEQGQLVAARQEAEVALRMNPRLAPAEFTIGLILERSGQLPDALTHYESSLRIDPAYTPAILRAANVLGRQKRYREAVDHYLAYMKLAPGSADAENNLGFLLVKMGDVEGAVPHYREALRLQPSFAEAANNLGVALERLGNTTEGIAYYRLALRLRPDFPEARQHLSDVLAPHGPK